MTGAVASKRVTEAFKGSLRLDGNQPESANAKGSLTARLTGRAGTKVGVSDPAVLNGKAVAQRIKATPGSFRPTEDTGYCSRTERPRGALL